MHMEEKIKVVAAGHICLDITPVFPDVNSVRFMEVFTPGKLINMKGIDIHVGGSSANTGLAFKKLGADVRILGKAGKDMLGDIVQMQMKEHGITRGLIRSDESGTSYSIILAIPGIDRIFLHDSGENDSYSADDVSDRELTGIDLFHFGYPSLMKNMYLNDGEELVRLLKRVHDKNIPISLDMAAIDSNSEAAQIDWISILERILPYVDVFLPSIEEVLFMADRRKYGDIMDGAKGKDITEVIQVESDVIPIAKQLINWGSKAVIVKCGSAGIYLETSGEAEMRLLAEKNVQIKVHEWAGKSIFEECYKPQKICSGTGAGDTCIAAFLMAMLKGYAPDTCLKLAAAQGASCVEAYDAFSGLKTLEELQRKIDLGWEKSR